MFRRCRHASFPYGRISLPHLLPAPVAVPWIMHGPGTSLASLIMCYPVCVCQYHTKRYIDDGTLTSTLLRVLASGEESYEDLAGEAWTNEQVLMQAGTCSQAA